MTETELIDKYICQHIEPEGDYLYRLYRATNIHTIHGRMASGHIQRQTSQDACRDDSPEEHSGSRHI